ncbi:MAG: ATP-binding cassette domain-containing protein [Bacteroidetes bacterium]|nr:ATP-binding cassette domain-containing protein [Bacteroidota bacterium]MDA0903313.1 ATP-binding cassette domain-containing protein [Bacteroidota bacterium]MDA1242279.1 ATP-binding cassette domain-containing protein [Bacteroidota bacterium]
MSIVVRQVEKVFGTQRALQGVSLEVGRGEVVGLLGPNGAGKSTLMRLITGYMPPTSGSVEVCGWDVVDHPLEIKRRLGYLPESNPLHLDMYVREALMFVAGLHRLSDRKQRVERVIEEVGLTPEAHKTLGELSKGYKQRVGLAQALIHDPEVLILDEPTSGLDPNQLVDIRALVRRLGKDRTVVLSTHIMQEVEAMCDRVVMIRLGELVADAPLQDMVQSEGGLEAQFKALTAG